MWTRTSLQDAINTWVTRYSTRRNELRATAENLPRQLAKREYRLKATNRLIPLRNPQWHYKAALPVNIIAIEPRDPSYEPGKATRTENEAFVCRNFDLSLCCVAMTITETLVYEFEEYQDAFTALQNRELKLSKISFTNRRNAIGVQLDRIRKYIDRGWRWPTI